MLMQRVLTAAVLVPLLLAAVWWLPTPWLFAVFALVGLFGAWEWCKLMSLRSPLARVLYVLLVALLLLFAWVWRSHSAWALGVALLWWLYALRLLRAYPVRYEQLRPGPVAMSLIGLLMLVPAVLSLARLHEGQDGALRLLYLFFLIMLADTGAYFVGRRFGKRKLAPSISPGKSVEGALGGMAACGLWALTAGVLVFDAAGIEVLQLLLLSLLVAAISIHGDLTESLFKRAAGVKDSGKLLPGHGGVLDRVDSLLAAAPAMAFGLRVLGF